MTSKSFRLDKPRWKYHHSASMVELEIGSTSSISLSLLVKSYYKPDLLLHLQDQSSSTHNSNSNQWCNSPWCNSLWCNSPWCNSPWCSSPWCSNQWCSNQWWELLKLFLSRWVVSHLKVINNSLPWASLNLVSNNPLWATNNLLVMFSPVSNSLDINNPQVTSLASLRPRSTFMLVACQATALLELASKCLTRSTTLCATSAEALDGTPTKTSHAADACARSVVAQAGTHARTSLARRWRSSTTE